MLPEGHQRPLGDGNLGQYGLRLAVIDALIGQCPFDHAQNVGGRLQILIAR